MLRVYEAWDGCFGYTSVAYINANRIYLSTANFKIPVFVTFYLFFLMGKKNLFVIRPEKKKNQLYNQLSTRIQKLLLNTFRFSKILDQQYPQQNQVIFLSSR